MTSDPWRYRCPEGHTSIRDRVSGGYYCDTCGTSYRGDPVDMRDGDTPDDAEGFDGYSMFGAVRAVWRVTGDTDTTARARHVTPHVESLAQALRDAEQKDLVETIHGSNGQRYRVTDRGRIFTPDGGTP